MSLQKSLATAGMMAELAGPGAAVLAGDNQSIDPTSTAMEQRADSVTSHDVLKHATGTLALRATRSENGFAFRVLPLASEIFAGNPAEGGSNMLFEDYASSNWSGYTLEGTGPYSAIEARMIVPDVT